MSVANLERFNLGVAIDNDPEGIWCRHAGHLASVNHLEKYIRELEAAMREIAGIPNMRDENNQRIEEARRIAARALASQSAKACEPK